MLQDIIKFKMERRWSEGVTVSLIITGLLCYCCHRTFK